MENSSFRDILLRFLEEDNADSPRKTTTQPRIQTEPMPLLQWQKPEMATPKKNAYPRPQPIPQAPRPAKPAPAPEPILALSVLNAADLVDVNLLIVLGAEELKAGISMKVLKRAHRRLAKALHPDHAGEDTRDLFISAQGAYERLSRALPKYKISESASDSGSASAPDYRRPGAA
jgi:hypothetical protein